MTMQELLHAHQEMGLSAGADLTTHVAAADPHTGYQKESEKDAASGYAGLTAATLVASTQIPVITDAQHGVRTQALAHAHSALSGITSVDHHASLSEETSTIQSVKAVDIRGAALALYLTDTGQADPAGRFRLLPSADVLTLQRAATA